MQKSLQVMRSPTYKEGEDNWAWIPGFKFFDFNLAHIKNRLVSILCLISPSILKMDFWNMADFLSRLWPRLTFCARLIVPPILGLWYDQTIWRVCRYLTIVIGNTRSGDQNSILWRMGKPMGTPHRKKNVFFRALPKLPPPLPPIRATCTTFSAVKKEYIKCIF